MELGLSGRNILVTGGSSGIGKATVEAFAAEGAHVALTYRENRAAGQAVAEAIAERFGVSAVALACDLSSQSSIQECFGLALGALESVDVLVNNAGYWPSSFVEDMDLMEWRTCIEVNLTGHMLFSREFFRHRIGRGLSGRITNVVSFAGFVGSTTGHSHYASAKAGLIGLTRSLAREGSQHRIAVNAVLKLRTL
jgi:3-oxoacyl-[acyl-carrier protein] reductase